jgi:acetyl esterase/lipase
VPDAYNSSDFHPELRRIARLIPKQVVTPVTLPAVRLVTRRMWRRVPKDVESLTLPSGVGVRLYRPPAATTAGPALLWIHGGGYVIGHPGQDDDLCRRYARSLNATVVSVDYRLAPEHPYPAALEDCYAALTWMTRLPSVDADRIAIGGASAGGGLAASLALMTRDRGEIAPAAQLLVYPMLDDRNVGRDRPNPALRLWNRSSNKFGWSAYLGDAEPEVAVPARRTDLSGLPPAWIGVGTLDLFHDEDLAYAQRLADAGVSCEVEVVKGAFHGFDGIVPKAQVSRSFFDSQCAMLRRLLVPAAA